MADKTYTMEKGTIFNKKFNFEETVYTVKFNSEEEPIENCKRMFDEVIDEAFVEPGDLVQIDVYHPDLHTPIHIAPSDRKKMTSDNAMNIISAVLQSAATVRMGSSMTIYVKRAGRVLVGSPPKDQKLLGEDAKCFIQMENDDDLCLARCIVYEKARLEQHGGEESRRHWQNIRQQDKCPRLRMAAKDLMAKAGLPEAKCGFAEVEKLQAVIPDYQIIVWDLGRKMLFKTPNQKSQINLLFNQEHCSIIKTITRFHKKSYYCADCYQGYDHREEHRCGNFCPYCLHPGKCLHTNWVTCPACRRVFTSQDCMDQHHQLTGQQQKTTCQLLNKCGGCNTGYQTSHPHHCGQQRCPSCKLHVQQKGHQWDCYIQPITEEEEPKKKKVKKPQSYIFFDFEARQEDEIKPGTYRHIINYCVAQKVCEDCMDTWDPVNTCDSCGGKQFIFEGEETVKLFCRWLFQGSNMDSVVMAHNLAGYDGQFLLEHITSIGLRPEVILRGSSIITMTVEKIKFLDSYAFLPMPLAALPKAFGFEKEVVKGYFPHYFNTKKNQDYEGEFPPLHFYDPDTKSTEDRAKLITWHAEQKGLFNFKQQMRDYCCDDVNILRRAALAFKKIFMDNTGVDPYLSSCTIASACSLVFRKNFLKPKTIGIVPHQGYRRSERQSIVAIQWLKWVSHSRDITIQHARNQGETKIGNYKADGYCKALNKVFEFHGCYYHGCPCMKDRKKVVNGRTMDEALAATEKKKRDLLDAKFDYEEIWQCQFDNQMEDNQEMADFIKGLDTVFPLNPRGAFFGGRTNAVALEKVAKDGEKIEYADFVSLYPTVQKNCEFPLGHPDIFTENFNTISAGNNPYFGLIKCEVLPPRGLLHPVLPVRCRGKLMFPLCQTCAEREVADCTHTDEERTIKGEWVTVEMDKALEKGYKITKVHEVWHYKAKSDSLFGEYVNCFLKLKAESTGYPHSVKTEEDKAAFVEDFMAKEGVQLDKDNITKNPGLRMIAKLCLNSFWGKFGQRNNLSKTVYCDTPEEYNKICFDDGVKINNMSQCGENIICLNYSRTDDFTDALPHTSPVVAAFTTAHARLKLYSCLEQLGPRVLYMDTDSVVYTVRPGEWRPQFGEQLGQMTNELEKDYGEGAYCSHFLGAGPKNYALRVEHKEGTSDIVKVKGLTLNYGAKKVVNFDSIREMMVPYLEQGDMNTLCIKYNQIGRSKDHIVTTTNTSKLYRIVYNKRHNFKDGTTQPWGY